MMVVSKTCILTLNNADVSYATTVGAVALTVAHDTAALSDSCKFCLSWIHSKRNGIHFNCFRSSCWNINKISCCLCLNDSVSLTGKTDQAAGAESVQTIGATTTLNGVSVSVESANNSTWDVDLGYTAGGFALTYGVDETDGWTATATSALGGGATFAAGVDSNDSMYAGVSFAF